jgi:hypothetical protein
LDPTMEWLDLLLSQQYSALYVKRNQHIPFFCVCLFHSSHFNDVICLTLGAFLQQLPE